MENYNVLDGHIDRRVSLLEGTGRLSALDRNVDDGRHIALMERKGIDTG